MDLAEKAARNIRQLESSGNLLGALHDQHRILLKAIVEIGKTSIAEKAILRELKRGAKTEGELITAGNAHRRGLVESFRRTVKKLADEGVIEIAHQTHNGGPKYRLAKRANGSKRPAPD